MQQTYGAQSLLCMLIDVSEGPAASAVYSGTFVISHNTALLKSVTRTPI